MYYNINKRKMVDIFKWILLKLKVEYPLSKLLMSLKRKYKYLNERTCYILLLNAIQMPMYKSLYTIF